MKDTNIKHPISKSWQTSRPVNTGHAATWKIRCHRNKAHFQKLLNHDDNDDDDEDNKIRHTCDETDRYETLCYQSEKASHRVCTLIILKQYCTVLVVVLKIKNDSTRETFLMFENEWMNEWINETKIILMILLLLVVFLSIRYIHLYITASRIHIDCNIQYIKRLLHRII